MDAIFPLGFPAPTALYLSLYVLTMVLHILLMNYVVAGTGYLMIVGVATGGPSVERHRTPLALALRDWMTVAVSAAITAGIAPLLFVQILYKERFYSANLLLSWRWMLILPALIVGFYLLYLYKSQLIGRWPRWVRAAAGLTALACFLFTGYTWTENHLLSMARDQWPQFYVQNSLFWWTPELLPRLALWFTGAIPNMAALATWHLAWASDRDATPDALRADLRRLVALGLGGLAASSLCAIGYVSLLSQEIQATLLGPLAAPWLLAALAGGLAQAAAWVLAWRQGRPRGAWRWLLGVGVLATTLGVTVAREAIRLARVDIAALAPLHADAADKAGSLAFVAFLLINAALIGWVIRTARGARPDTDAHRG
jgi:hypothetical protein